MILSELIQRAVDIASKSVDTAVTRLALETAAEPLLGIVFHEVSVDKARNEYKRSLLTRTKTLAVVNGSVAIPTDVLTEYMWDSHLIDTTAPTKRYSLTPWHQFITAALDRRLGHYSVEGESTLHVIEPATSYSPTSGPTETLLLSVPCVVVVPAATTDAIVARDEILDDLVRGLASALNTKF